MTKALAATALLLGTVAATATAQDTTRAGQNQGRADSARVGVDTTIQRSGQQAQADSAWRQGGDSLGRKQDSTTTYGRDSLPQGAKKENAEQDAVNPKLDAQGRPESAAADSMSRNPTSSSTRTNSSIETMDPSSSSNASPTATPPSASGSPTTPSNQVGYAGQSRKDVAASDWFNEVREAAKDEQTSKDPQAVPGTQGRQPGVDQSASDVAPSSSSVTTDVEKASKDATGEQGRSGREQDNPAATGKQENVNPSSYSNDSPGETTATTQPQPVAPSSTDEKDKTESSSTTGRQGNAANAPENRGSTSSTTTTTQPQ